MYVWCSDLVTVVCATLCTTVLCLIFSFWRLLTRAIRLSSTGGRFTRWLAWRITVVYTTHLAWRMTAQV